MELKQAVIGWLLEKEKADYHQGVMLLMKAGERTFGMDHENSENRKTVRRKLQARLLKDDLSGELTTKAMTHGGRSKTASIQTDDMEDIGDMVVMSDEAKMQIDKRNFVKSRIMLSNSFHDCNSDSERKRVYDKLMAVEAAYQEQIKKIKYYKQTGQMLEEATDNPSTAIPDNPVELLRARNNLRSNISKKLKIMDTFPVNHPRNIKAHTQYLALNKKMKEVEEKLKKY